jgi:hypothetical protein
MTEQKIVTEKPNFLSDHGISLKAARGGKEPRLDLAHTLLNKSRPRVHLSGQIIELLR